MKKRRETLMRIQTRKLDKIKLQACAYADTDETYLKLHGLSDCRRKLVLSVLRNKLVSLT